VAVVAVVAARASVVVGAVAAAVIARMPPRKKLHRISIAREQYKFSCAHMTVFPDGTKERLHGHNYTLAIALEVTDVSLPAMIPFSQVKDALGALCAKWKEHVMVATANPRFDLVGSDANGYRFRLGGELYQLPNEDVLELPIDNISVEALASHAADELLAVLTLPATVLAIEVTVEESPGQGSRCRVEL
jgi:6-pyruvoyltetrahydropterin/6-carboxytetrahydropterin synthase